jgi:hypothetical protein
LNNSIKIEYLVNIKITENDYFHSIYTETIE